MTLRLALIRRAAPERLKSRLLDELALVTAEGFGCPRPQWTGRRFDARLAEYERFTAANAEELLARHDAAATDAARERLHRGAVRLGGTLRRQLGVRSDEEALEALAVLYHHLGIEMEVDRHGSEADRFDSEVDRPGGLVVTRCRFASSFSEPVCGLVAGLDEGIAAGLSGGGRLEFVERITGGSACCRARFIPAGRP
jgi:hypothetical protein